MNDWYYSVIGYNISAIRDVTPIAEKASSDTKTSRVGLWLHEPVNCEESMWLKKYHQTCKTSFVPFISAKKKTKHMAAISLEVDDSARQVGSRGLIGW